MNHSNTLRSALGDYTDGTRSLASDVKDVLSRPAIGPDGVQKLTISALLGSLMGGADKGDKKKLGELLAVMEPLNYAHRVSRDRILMLNGSRDEVIPKASTEKLYLAFGKPKIHWYNAGHYGAALHLFNIMRRSLKHLRG